ncbi:hypothetical protein [Sphaerisporangium sp. TRM90804]|uniref:hypothetical protein n=1 Tax=Sphaerisporangium sp. TRM90804 TaxID=3031113 RepID=UPI002448BDFF|nr:hypothetical protein [Sphaerisporangium sp. TRM90804]MDH2429338.1 hypothetical protein [Sphaerisporangium sp. TRM90804]
MTLLEQLLAVAAAFGLLGMAALHSRVKNLKLLLDQAHRQYRAEVRNNAVRQRELVNGALRHAAQLNRITDRAHTVNGHDPR